MYVAINIIKVVCREFRVRSSISIRETIHKQSIFGRAPLRVRLTIMAGTTGLIRYLVVGIFDKIVVFVIFDAALKKTVISEII